MIVFLDIDGVLVCHRVHCAYGDEGEMKRFDPAAVALLNRYADRTVIVVSSTWRKYNTRESMETIFAQNGLVVPLHDDWKTIVGRGFRGDEVDEWLSRHPEVTDYVCVDDDGDFHDHQRHIKTHCHDGFVAEAVVEYIDLMEGNDEDR
ncbi:MAG: HAD domain-containing protein [Candidimonas sp.]